MMIRVACVLGLLSGMVGCASVIPIDVTNMPPGMFDVESFTVPSPQSSAELAALTPGSRVRLSHHSENLELRVEGEVLHASPEGVALMNVTRRASSQQATPILHKVPHVSRLFKNTGVGVEQVPVYWMPNYLISATEVVAPPPEGYVAPQLDINTQSGPVFERIGIDFDFNTNETVGTLSDSPRLSQKSHANSAAF